MEILKNWRKNRSQKLLQTNFQNVSLEDNSLIPFFVTFLWITDSAKNLAAFISTFLPLPLSSKKITRIYLINKVLEKFSSMDI